MKTIKPAELDRGSALLVDVRTPAEYEEIHLRDSISRPLGAIRADEIRQLAGGRTVALLCRTGNRAGQACRDLAREGLENIVVVEGGVPACEEEGWAVARGRRTISLERQVRIAAGALVLAGVTLGYLVHTGFFALAGFVGAGLIFAGVTDWCGMGMLLARMPWNNRPPAPARSVKNA